MKDRIIGIIGIVLLSVGYQMMRDSTNIHWEAFGFGLFVGGLRVLITVWAKD